MNIESQLLIAHSKSNTKKIVDFIETDKLRLKELMNCFFHGEYRVSQRSAMAISLQFDRHPKTLESYIDKIISNLMTNDLHVAVKRNSLRILQFITIPEESTSILFDKCLEFLVTKKEPIAVKVFSMTILANICKVYPELKSELIPVIELELNRKLGNNKPRKKDSKGTSKIKS